jgi:GT2 family glycosyltransferase
VTYQCRDAARDCLRSLYETTDDVGFEVVVVDNASADGTVEMIRSEFPQVRLVAMERNLGFAAGMNLAGESAEGEFVLLLNPDTIVHRGAVSTLVRFAREHPQHGLYGGRTLWPDGRVCPGSCWGQPTLWSLFCFATMLNSAFKGSRLFDPESLGGWERDSVREVGIVTGCLLLAPRAVWRQLGGFDERFFMYGEDADLSMRAWAAGYRPAITPESVITHEVGVSSETRPDKVILLLRGKATLVRKHWSGPRRRLGLSLLVLGVGVRALAATLPWRRHAPTPTAWREAWRIRRDWVEGYPAPAKPRLQVVA